jgi:Flp pilus assembly protein TadB
MVSALFPIAMFAAAGTTIVLLFLSVWGGVNETAVARVTSWGDRLDRAGIQAKPQDLVLAVAAILALVWVGILLLLHPSFLVTVLLIPVLGLAGTMAFSSYVNFKLARRLAEFVSQLEVALHLLAGGLRVGLSMRQALATVIEELPDPARYEFRRVIGQTNLGVSIVDAVDDLARRMPNHETLMTARVFRAQQQTGGDLARVLDMLADTIKGRRQVQRKITALTAEGRMSAWVLMLIPLALGSFIVGTQADMGHALLFTTIGHIVIIIIVVLETVAFFWLRMLLRIQV